MKKYCGKKIVEAEPMTMGDAYEKGLLQAGRTPDAEYAEHVGYHVKYKDGYESWSPQDVFEEAYKPYDDFVDRLVIERDELKERIDKLDLFVGSVKFAELGADERILLEQQLNVMHTYIRILEERLSICKSKKSE